MSLISSRSLEDRLTVSFNNTRAIAFFCKSLYVFAAFKIVLAAPAILTILKIAPVKVHSDFVGWLIFFPAWLANDYPHIFLALSVLVILVSVLLPLNYFSGIVIFWIALNLFRITLPAANGSDLVLTLMLFFSVFLSRWPEASGRIGAMVQITIHNLALLLCRLQIAFIYLLSGWDKLQSGMWKSGEALFAINKIDYTVNPSVELDLTPDNWKFISWIVIGFEMLFPLFIWIPGIRIVMIALGMIFHIAIWIWLSLPDFGLIMIITLFVFLNDEDHKRIRSMFRR
jgi:uncharacterized membrane protein YphA (DoxX/SURF4 family)